jgi:cytochrome c-type biogenesis protein CcmH
MIVFWLLIAVLTCAATAAVIVPLVRDHAESTVDGERVQRLTVYRDRKKELERERDAGRLTDAEASRAIDELASDAATLLGAGGGTNRSPVAADATIASGMALKTPAPRRSFAIAAVLAVAIPIASMLIYRQIGAPDIVSLDSIVARGETGPAQIQAAIDELKARTRSHPDDGEAWANLAEGLRINEDLPGAAAAFEQAIRLAPHDAKLLAEYAETIAASRKGDFTGQPVALLEQALAIDPRNPKALALMGAAQYRLGHPDRAVGRLRELLAVLDPQSEQARQIEAVVNRLEAEARAPASGAAGAAPNSGLRSGAAGPSGAASGPASATITGTIRIADALRGQLDPQATLFIVARAPDGPRIPYAAIKARADQFPLAFTLSDEQAMNPERALSSATQVVVEARLSRSGTPSRKSGDLYGVSGTIKPGASGLTIEIDQVVQ